jgi:hypothetical protein
MRNAEFGLRALNSISSLLIFAQLEIIKAEPEFKARIPQSEIRI